MQQTAITTRYRRGIMTARDTDGVSVRLPFDHTVQGEGGMHAAAAKALCVKLGYVGEMVGGGTKTGMVFVFTDRVRFNA